MYYLKKIIQLMNKLILQDKNLFYFSEKTKIKFNKNYKNLFFSPLIKTFFNILFEFNISKNILIPFLLIEQPFLKNKRHIF